MVWKPYLSTLTNSSFHVSSGPCSLNTAVTPQSGRQPTHIPARMGTGFKTNEVASAGALPTGSALGALEVTEAGLSLCSYPRHK